MTKTGQRLIKQAVTRIAVGMLFAGIATAELTPIGPGDNLGLPYVGCHPPGVTEKVSIC